MGVAFGEESLQWDGTPIAYEVGIRLDVEVIAEVLQVLGRMAFRLPDSLHVDNRDAIPTETGNVFYAQHSPPDQRGSFETTVLARDDHAVTHDHSLAGRATPSDPQREWGDPTGRVGPYPPCPIPRPIRAW